MDVAGDALSEQMRNLQTRRHEDFTPGFSLATNGRGFISEGVAIFV
jgi:hypothetical protein